MTWTILRWGVFVRPDGGSEYGRIVAYFDKRRTVNRLAQNGKPIS